MKQTISLKVNRILKSSVFIGAFWLTLSGVVSRILGFLYRIFLSREIGAESLGLYQLILPLFALCTSFCAAGIQSAVSHFVAGASGKQKSNGSFVPAIAYLYAGLTLSVLCSALCSLLIHHFREPIATRILGNGACAPLLCLMSYCPIPASIRSCISGYYFGQKKAVVPSVCQLAEQAARVFGVYLLYRIATAGGKPLSATDAAWGLLFGELCSFMISLTVLLLSGQPAITGAAYRKAFPALFSLAVPLTLNQTLSHLSASVENLLIPRGLQLYGHSAPEALSVYGVFSGMVMSVIFFPCVLTNSVSVMLLPAISEANAGKNHARIAKTISVACLYGTLFGTFFAVLFSLSGNWIGCFLFRNELAGHMIRRLCWLCPLIFVYSLLASVINGLGESKSVLYISLLSSFIRIGMILLFVPHFGMDAALFGMLIAQLFSVLSALYVARSKAVPSSPAEQSGTSGGAFFIS